MKPKKITVRPANNLEGEGIIVWVYHRKAQIQLSFEHFPNVETCINEAVDAWRHAVWKLGYNGLS